MKLAMPVADSRVSAALDFARQLLLVEYEHGREVRRATIALQEQIPMNRARKLARLGVDVLICGAISRPLSEHLEAAGIQVIPFVSGTSDEVLLAYRTNSLDSVHFLMPGNTVEERREWMTRRSAVQARAVR